MDVINKIAAMFPPINKEETCFLGRCVVLENAHTRLHSHCEPSLLSDLKEQ